MNKVTLKDIAELANVSITTVSLVLNDKPSRISDAKKTEIKELAKKYNYSPNLNARGLAMNSSKTIGLVIPDIENPFFASLAKNLENSLRVKDYALILINTDDLLENDIRAVNVLNNRGVDGFLLVLSNESFSNNVRIFEELTSLMKPFVLIDRIFEDVKFNQVAYDNYLGQYLAITHLIERGYKDIGFIAPPYDSFNSKSRFKGYKQALKENSIDINRDLIVYGNYRFEDGYKQSASLISNGAKAIAASNDISAYGVIKRVAELGLNIPDDIAITGYDDLIFSNMSISSLTTIRQDTIKLADEAVKLLMDALIDKGLPKTVVLEPELMIRNSTKNIMND